MCLHGVVLKGHRWSEVALRWARCRVASHVSFWFGVSGKVSFPLCLCFLCHVFFNPARKPFFGILVCTRFFVVASHLSCVNFFAGCIFSFFLRLVDLRILGRQPLAAPDRSGLCECRGGLAYGCFVPGCINLSVRWYGKLISRGRTRFYRLLSPADARFSPMLLVPFTGIDANTDCGPAGADADAAFAV